MKKSQYLLAVISIFTLLVGAALAQQPSRRGARTTLMEAGGEPVIGSGTPGRLSKWTGVLGTSTSTLGNSNIFDDKFGRVGIGTTNPTSLLTVQGMIETTLGGYKFPDGTVQTTAGISFVTHDASLAGLGTDASPLGIAVGGVNTVHLANGAVTAPKIANGTVVRSFNGLFDNVSLVAGNNITITPAGNTLTISAPNTLTSVAHDATLSGNGTTASPLGVAAGGINTAQLADGSVTLSKIAVNQVVTSLNNLREAVTLAAGSNITITPSGNTLTIAGTAGSSSSAYHATSSQFFTISPPGVDIISKQVPAGSYIIFFKIDLSLNDTSPQNASCTLSTGDSSTIRLPGAGATDFLFRGMVVLQDAATFSAPTTITVHCSGFRYGTFQSKAVLTAIKVGSIQ